MIIAVWPSKCHHEVGALIEASTEPSFPNHPVLPYWLRCIIRTSALEAMYYDVISVKVKVRIRILVRLMHLIHLTLSPWTKHQDTSILSHHGPIYL